jgi:glyoxylase-like metal-dependent hydrolase (beta-lactamase superfamily II)
MKIKFALMIVYVAFLSVFAASLPAQDLGPQFKKIKDGIYVQTANDLNSNCGIILTRDGVVLIDSGHNPTDSLAVLNAVRKLTTLPIRFLINTENHPDHVTGDFVFSPPTVVIAGEGASDGIRKNYNPDYYKNLMEQSKEMRDAFLGYQTVYPQIEYHEKMTLTVGERTLVLLTLKNVHSDADTAIWLPQERVLFSASAAVPNRFNNIRSFVTIPDILNATKMMKALNPEIVVPGHGSPGTTKIFDDSDQFYELLVARVAKMVRDGKSLDQIKQDLRMPEYDNWLVKDRFPTNVEAAYRAVKAGYSPSAK